MVAGHDPDHIHCNDLHHPIVDKNHILFSGRLKDPSSSLDTVEEEGDENSDQSFPMVNVLPQIPYFFLCFYLTPSPVLFSTISQ